MDPEENLKQQYQLSKAIIEALDSNDMNMDHAILEMANALAELVVAYHDWRRKGGFEAIGKN